MVGLNIMDIRNIIDNENSYNPSVLSSLALAIEHTVYFKRIFNYVILATAFDLQKITTT